MPIEDDEQTAVRATLEALIESLEAALAESAEAAKPVRLDQDAVGRVSRIDAIQQQQMVEAGRRSITSRIQLARSALARLAADEYGDCLACGEAIDPARLAARPESLHCVECQNARER